MKSTIRLFRAVNITSKKKKKASKELLEKAGGILVANKNECDIDLSPESLEKDTIINLIKREK